MKQKDILTCLTTAATIVLFCFLMYGLWSIRSYFYYDAQPVRDTVREIVKPECLK